MSLQAHDSHQTLHGGLARVFVVPLAAVFLASCSQGGRDLNDFGPQVIGGTLHGQTYNAFDENRDDVASSSFEGFHCVTFCEEHAAGYRWAGAQDDIAAEDCRRRSWGFTEGCIVYLAEVGAFDRDYPD